MSTSNISKWLEEGVRLHQAGRMADAARLYEKVLKLDARNPDALNLKGLIAAHALRFAEALALYDKAIAAYPEFANAHCNKGTALAALGRSADAVAAYAKAIQFQPTHADARIGTGILFHKMGRVEDAVAAFRAMTQFCPDDWRGLYNLGSCLSTSLKAAPEDARSAKAGEAVAALSRALELSPGNEDVRLALAHAQAQHGDHRAAAETLRAAFEKARNWPLQKRAETLSTLGEYLRKQGRHGDAIERHQQAVGLCPENHLFKFNLAAALYDAGRRDEAADFYQQVIAIKPDFADAHVNLGNIHRDRNEQEKAISAFEKALTFGPVPQAYTNIGATMSDLGWISTSLMLHDKAVALGPANASTRHYRALTLLSQGRFALGWEEHEARFDVSDVGTVRRPQREWRGEDLSGKRILVWTEQGIGDQILHASMIPDLIACADHVLIECVGRLAPVFARSFCNATVIARTHLSATPAASEEYDFQIAAGSLGKYLRHDYASFPPRESYLQADPAKVEQFRRKYADMARGRRVVGLAWRSRNHRMGPDKSTLLADLAPVLRTADTLFVNLQYGNCAEELAEARETFGADIFEDPDVDQLKDMDTFFAQVAAMDLVVTTSNSAAHVAGSQGVPTRLLLPGGKGLLWYWFHHRADSPWYPSVKIFRTRSTRPDPAWAIEPAGRVASELANWSAHVERNVP